MSNGVTYYVNKDGDKKIGKPEDSAIFEKIGYELEKKAKPAKAKAE